MKCLYGRIPADVLRAAAGCNSQVQRGLLKGPAQCNCFPAVIMASYSSNSRVTSGVQHSETNSSNYLDGSLSMWRVAALQDAHRRWVREKHWIKQICVLRWEQWPDWSVKLFTCNLQDVKNSLRSAMMKFAEMLLCSGRVAQRQVHENETFVYFGCVNLMISSRWKK